MKNIIITGAAGFCGANLVEVLVNQAENIYAVVRPGSPHNIRLQSYKNVTLIPLELSKIQELPQHVDGSCDTFFHLAWQGGRYDFSGQYQNIEDTLKALEAAKTLGCKRFICTGSQAEYGIQTGLTTEETLPQPSDAYGAAKLAACILSRERAKDLAIEWIWGRIFSLYGKYEPSGRLLSDLVASLKRQNEFSMTEGKQNWDYLYAADGARALVALAERGRSGEIYNIANGAYRPLREFSEMARKIISPTTKINYGKSSIAPVGLQPSVKKIQHDTGWWAETSFAEGLICGYAKKMEENELSCRKKLEK